MEDHKPHIPGIGDQPEETPIHGYRNREVFYFYDKEKGFINKVQPHNNIVQVLIKQSWDITGDKIEETRKKAEAGEISPVAYHMERCVMDLVTLAAYTGLPKWRIKRHFRPAVYKKLDEPTKKRYADAFEITVTELDQLSV
jgi:hypothetical protein